MDVYVESHSARRAVNCLSIIGHLCSCMEMLFVWAKTGRAISGSSLLDRCGGFSLNLRFVFKSYIYVVFVNDIKLLRKGLKRIL